jgi:phage-related protein
MAERPERHRKSLYWVGSSKEDLSAFPEEVKRVMGFALHVAQTGGKHLDAKPLKGFKGAGVLELVEEHEGNAFRAVYTVRFANSVYVLHAFQKKSRKGIATQKSEIDLVKERLKRAEQDHEQRSKSRK